MQALTKTVILQVPNHQTHNYVTLSVGFRNSDHEVSILNCNFVFTIQKELMEKAQAIFVTANRATRPEKEHILKFMAGTRGSAPTVP